jgi:type II secretory pathway component GspD/PulD (secretin)
MRKAVMGITALLLASLQSGQAETVTTAQDYAVDSDVVLESAVREIKSVPKDTVNVIGDAVKMVADETATAVNGIKAAFRADPLEKIEKNASLEVANAWNSANDVIFRSYKVSESVGKELAEGREISAETGAMDVSGYFNGMAFPKGTSAMYRPEFKRLFVRQTLENMLSIEDVLAEEHNAKRNLMGKQVEIQTKFIEVNQSTLNELGFNWNFDSKHGGSASIFENLVLPANQDILTQGLRTAGRIAGVTTGTGTGLDDDKTAAFGAAVVDSDTLVIQKSAGSLRWTLVITALEQSDNADVLCAPSITTRDGKAASIYVGEQRMVPKSFAAKAQNTSIFVENSDWKSELMGVQLDVTPELRKGGMIDLDLKPKVIDMIGYDTYQVTPTDANFEILAFGNQIQNRKSLLANNFVGTANVLASTGLTVFENVALNGTNGIPNPNFSEIRVPTLFGQLPYFRLREMTTKVTVADGNTVGMGGLIYDKIETYKDKVPVLGSIPLIGRLFRSEGEKTIKRNLMIFVTATEVDVNGRRAADMAMKK